MNTLRNGARVTVKRFHYAGYRGHVVDRDNCNRFYKVRVTHDRTGKRLAEPFEHGLYARKELEHKQPTHELRPDAP